MNTKKKKIILAGFIAILVCLICLLYSLANRHTILDEQVPLAGTKNAVFYINESGIASQNVSSYSCKKIGTGTISYQGSRIYNENGLDEYIVTTPDLSKYVSEGQAVRWVKIYRSFTSYSVIGEIYECKQPVATEQLNFAHTVGTDIYIGDEKYIINGVVASNAVASSPAVYNENMMTEADYEEIASLGFNTVRFLFNYNILEDDANPYVYKQSGWDWFDKNLEWAKKHGIHIILDCHLSQGGIPSTGGNQNVWVAGQPNQERLVAMWKAIAEKYKDNDTIIAYGLLNEPFVENNDNEAWNNLLNRIIQSVRSSDKNHMLMIQRAQIGDDKKYLYPSVYDSNWCLEVHKYPNVDMKLVERYFVIPEDFLYYGNKNIVGYRDANTSTESAKTSISIDQKSGLSTEWKDYSFDFVAGDSNNAYIVLEVMNLSDNQTIEVSDLTVKCGDEEVFNMTYNLDDNYNSWSKTNTHSIDYKASSNLISITGSTAYLSIADNSVFRYFMVEPGVKYTVSLKARTQTGVGSSTVLKATAKEYKSQKIYSLDKAYTQMLLDFSEQQSNYNVPIYYGEIGVLRSLYDTNRKMEDLSADMINFMRENSYNYTWFTWHEPTFGIYTSSGLAPKSNPNEVLLQQFKGTYGNN